MRHNFVAKQVPYTITDFATHITCFASSEHTPSWTYGQLTPELMECMFVNSMAPFVLNSRLNSLMSRRPEGSDRPDRYIINVSAMEGKVSQPSVSFAVGQRFASSLTTPSFLLIYSSSIATR